jgi:hypothetical protein
VSLSEDERPKDHTEEERGFQEEEVASERNCNGEEKGVNEDDDNAVTMEPLINLA